MVVRFRDLRAQTASFALPLVLLALSCGGRLSKELRDDEAAGGVVTGSGGSQGAGGSFTEGGVGALPGIAGASAGAGAIAGQDVGTGALCPAGRECIPSIPKGWQGPIAAHDTSLGGQAPACAGAYGRTESPMHAGVDGGTHACACSCRLPEGLGCGQASFELFADDSCAGSVNAVMSLWPNGKGSCAGKANPSTDAYGSVRLADIAPLDAGSTCAPIAKASVGEPSWKDTLTACLANDAPTLCGAETLCVEAIAPAFNLGVCIYSEGDSPCPKGYKGRLVRYREYVDDRRCAACTCGPPDGVCTPHVELTANQLTCADTVLLDSVGACRPFTVPASTPAILYHYVGEPQGGDSCPPSEGKAVGRVEQTHPVTVCCDRAIRAMP